MLLEARSLTREPILLYNLGRAYEGLGELERALAAYEEYLQEAPRAPDRETTERRVEALKREIAERKAAPPPTPTPAPATPPPAAAQPAAAPPPPPPITRNPSVVPIVVVGAGLATLAGGGVFGLLTNRAHDDAVANPRGPGATSDQDRAETFSVVANACFVAGGVLTAAGIAWTIVDRTGTAPGTGTGRSSAALRLTPLGAVGTF